MKKDIDCEVVLAGVMARYGVSPCHLCDPEIIDIDPDLFGGVWRDAADSYLCK